MSLRSHLTPIGELFSSWVCGFQEFSCLELWKDLHPEWQISCPKLWLMESFAAESPCPVIIVPFPLPPRHHTDWKVIIGLHHHHPSLGLRGCLLLKMQTLLLLLCNLSPRYPQPTNFWERKNTLSLCSRH